MDELPTVGSEAFQALSKRHRAIARLLLVDGATLDEIAAMYQVHRVTAWRWAQEIYTGLADNATTGSDVPTGLRPRASEAE